MMAIGLTTAVQVASIDNFLFVGFLVARLEGAIVNAIAEVFVLAQTDHIRTTAAQLFGFSQHGVDAV